MRRLVRGDMADLSIYLSIYLSQMSPGCLVLHVFGPGSSVGSSLRGGCCEDALPLSGLAFEVAGFALADGYGKGWCEG